MAETIQITLNELQNLIKESIDWMLISEKKGENCTYKEIIEFKLYEKGYITEMAFRKKEFIKIIWDLKDQLIENWCLCAYCSLYDRINENFNHWCVEFASYANKIKRCTIKNGDKNKIIYDLYIKKLDLNVSDMVFRIIRGKFNREQIGIDIAKEISEIASKNTEVLVSFLSNDNYDTEEYIMRTFQ